MKKTDIKKQDELRPEYDFETLKVRRVGPGHKDFAKYSNSSSDNTPFPISEGFFDHIQASIDFISTGSYAPNSQQYQNREALSIIIKKPPITLTIQEFPGNQLRVYVGSTDISVKSVFVSIVGKSIIIEEKLNLVADEKKAVGEKFYPNFDELIQKLGDKIDVSVSSDKHFSLNP